MKPWGPPARHQPSSRSPSKLRSPEYGDEVIVRRVRSNGCGEEARST